MPERRGAVEGAWRRLRDAATHWGGEGVCEVAERPRALLWLYGSTMIEATAEEDGAVMLRAFLVMGPTHPHPEQVLSSYQRRLASGTLRLDEEGDAILESRLPPELGARAFDWQVRAFCEAADQVDDLLHEEIGGMLSFDLFEWDVMQAVRGELGSAL